jgi:hypothetical protein
MKKTAALLVASVAVATLGAPSAFAGPKKTVTEKWTATAMFPDPSNQTGQGYGTCAQNVPGSFDSHPFKIPAAGSLHVDLTNFHGDWDLLILDSDKSEIGGSGNDPETAESTDVTFRKAQTVTIVACNFAGTPTADVAAVFTFKK